MAEETTRGESQNPKFWLAFRTSDDGMGPSRDAATNPASTSNITQKTFPQFAKLPPEIRSKIWTELVQPRIIVACCLRRPDTDDETSVHASTNGGDRDEDRDEAATSPDRKTLNRLTTTGSPVPVILQVNRESRSVGLQHYELTFGWGVTKLLSDTPSSSPPRVYFNFEADALLLAGDLEVFDSYGVNSHIVYFLKRGDTHRIKHVACAFSGLGYPAQESDMIFGTLWHVVDRFPTAKRVLLTVGEGDEERLGGVGDLALGANADNVVQKIWSGWMSGTTVTGSRMAGKQMILVKEEELMGLVAAG